MTSSRNTWLLSCIGWGVGTAGVATFNFSRTLILRFMTDFLEISAVVAGFLFAFSKVFDAVTDPLMGALSDRTDTVWGRRRPYLLAGAILCGGVYVLLFNVPSFESGSILTAYMAMILALYAIAYTVFNVPYLAMPVEMTSDHHARSFLVSFRAVGVGVGNLLGGIVGPLVIVAYGGGMVGHRAMSWVLGLITLSLMLLCFVATARAPFLRYDPKASGFAFRQLPSIFRNRPYVVLLSAKGLLFIAVAVLTTSSAYFTTHVLEAADTVLALFFGGFFLGVAASQPVWIKVSKIWGKPTSYTVACTLAALANLTWIFAGTDESHTSFVVRSVVVGFMMGGVMVMGNSMLPDTLDIDTRRNAVRREGLLVGFYTTLEKGGSALGIAIVGLFLGSMGYIESQASDAVHQPATAIFAIRLCFSVVPAIALFLSGLILRFYSVDPDHAVADLR